MRAVEVLRNADVILCEDTRVTKKLQQHFDIQTPTRSFHQHSGEKEMYDIAEELKAGKRMALVTDAGTPNISDPGGQLVAFVCRHAPEAIITPIPGPSAVIAALSVSGFPADRFLFLGFPPQKKGRSAFFQKIAHTEETVVFYESSHRIIKTLTALEEAAGPDRMACVCRELTKAFESVYRGSIQKIREMRIPEKGEFVVALEPQRMKKGRGKTH